MIVIFFFQAEDGIRDVAVTGVQTCALPIYFEFLGGKRVVLGAHRQFSSTNYLGCQAKSVDPRAPKEPSGYNRFRKWHGYTKPARDRKSTRLNSSHGYISYAVFCLKKKKRNHIRPAGSRSTL